MMREILNDVLACYERTTLLQYVALTQSTPNAPYWGIVLIGQPGASQGTVFIQAAERIIHTPWGDTWRWHLVKLMEVLPVEEVQQKHRDAWESYQQDGPMYP